LARFGTPQEIYGSPVNEFADDFIGAANIIHRELIEGPDAHGRARVRTPPLTFSPTELMSLTSAENS